VNEGVVTHWGGVGCRARNKQTNKQSLRTISRVLNLYIRY